MTVPTPVQNTDAQPTRSNAPSIVLAVAMLLAAAMLVLHPIRPTHPTSRSIGSMSPSEPTR